MTPPACRADDPGRRTTVSVSRGQRQTGRLLRVVPRVSSAIGMRAESPARSLRSRGYNTVSRSLAAPARDIRCRSVLEPSDGKGRFGAHRTVCSGVEWDESCWPFDVLLPRQATFARSTVWWSRLPSRDAGTPLTPWLGGTHRPGRERLVTTGAVARRIQAGYCLDRGR